MQKVQAAARNTGLLRKVFSLPFTAGNTAPRRENGQKNSAASNQGSSHREMGTVKWYNPVMGYGFIAPVTGAQAIFVHASDVEMARRAKLDQGQKVEYDRVKSRGKTAAKNLKVR